MSSVSIIMPAYNAQRFIGRAINSVLNQTFLDWELLIVDDGSTDGTAGYVKYHYSSPQIKLFTQSNQGPASARNAGIEHAQGEFIAFLDADDCWRPNKLSLQIPLFATDSTGVVYGDAELVGGKIEGYSTFFAINPPASGRVTSQLVRRNFIPMLTAVIRRDLLRKIGGFDSDLRAAEDYDVWLRASFHTDFSYSPEIVAEYTIHTESTTSKSELMWTSELQALRKCWGVRQNVLDLNTTKKLANRIATLADKIRPINELEARRSWLDVWKYTTPTSWPGRWLRFSR